MYITPGLFWFSVWGLGILLALYTWFIWVPLLMTTLIVIFALPLELIFIFWAGLRKLSSKFLDIILARPPNDDSVLWPKTK